MSLKSVLLFGDRSEFRLGEKIRSIVFKAVSFVMVGQFAKYKAIEANIVAKGMLHTVHQEKLTGVVILESEKIRRIATAPEEYPMIRR